SLGERFNLLTQYTAFVAVDKLRITVGGQPRLVHVPIELPSDATWEGFFGPPRPVLPSDRDIALAQRRQQLRVYRDELLKHQSLPSNDTPEAAEARRDLQQRLDRVEDRLQRLDAEAAPGMHDAARVIYDIEE